jgi:ceramide glucosyltransferase
VLITVALCLLTLLGVGLLLWQFIAAMRFPMHRRERSHAFVPAITLLKPLKGCDEHTRDCLRSWFTQAYSGDLQILLGVAELDDPACDVVRSLLKEFPARDAELVITAASLGANAKVSNLAQLARRARHAVICVSDADVRVPADLLVNAVAPLRDSAVGLVNCFYRLANPSTLAMRWEEVAVNADFWSQVLQSNTLKPQNFALGAVMILRREALEEVGGFESLLDYLADDYQLGHRLAESGRRIVLSPVVVECWDRPMSFRDVWRHQLRWARTIRVSQPLPFFFSILSNVTLWGTLFAASSAIHLMQAEHPRSLNLSFLVISLVSLLPVLLFRMAIAFALEMRLAGRRLPIGHGVMAIFKDAMHVALWAAAFLGDTVEWRGRRFRLGRGGKLVPLDESE